MGSEIPQWVYNAAREIEVAQDGDEGQSHYPIYHQQIAEIFMKHMRREQGVACPSCDSTDRGVRLVTHSGTRYCADAWHSEQPQGEVTRCPHGTESPELCVICGAQTEGGEKPQVCHNPNHFHTDGSPSEHEIGSSCMAEPASRPATAGTAREFRDVQCFQENQWDDERAEAYADQGADATIVSLNRRLTEVLEAKVALATEVAQLRQERDALKAKLEGK